VPHSTPADDPRLTSRRERAAGRILDDEHLRGDLTDDEYKPLLDWALDLIDRVALGTAGEDDDRADYVLGGATREIVDILRLANRAVVAHRRRHRADRRESLSDIDCIVDEKYRASSPDTHHGPFERLADRLDNEPDLDTVTVTKEIVRAINDLSDDTPGRPRK